MQLIKDIKKLAGILPKPHSFKKGEALDVINSIDNAFLLINEGKILDFGPMSECPAPVESSISAKGQMILPSWCDSHTHIVYAASREEEFVSRIKGKSYEEIAAEGGGILNSARKLQVAEFDQLYDDAAQRLEEVMAFGTGAIEIKSGYGLTKNSELKMLRVIKKLKENYPITIKSTFLGAHAIPTEYKNDRSGYIKILIDEMLPQIADEGLADYCDVFCDKGFYTIEETDLILKAASKYGLKAKIHANELGITGGVQVGIANNALSVDHLECIGVDEINALLNSNTTPTLLPSTSFFLNIPYGPARKMIDAGLGIAIATDYNPGSTPSGNVPFLLSLACLKLKMTPTEAINAITINGAFAMELNKDHGSITKGKWANLIFTKDIPSLDFIPYAFGSNVIDKTMIKGRFI